MDIKILVAMHKTYWSPSDDVYLPLHVGREGKQGLGIIGDNTGDNISCKNANYCELTGLYWAWKNLYCDYIGLCHYRRYFAHKPKNNEIYEKRRAILTKKNYEILLDKYDVILPKKRNYYIETVKSQYEHAHKKQDLAKVENIIKEKYPEYSSDFQQIMKERKLYIYNMFVMKKELFDDYCFWLFTILFELEKQIDLREYNDYQKRVFGFISERLFNVWLRHQNLKIIEIPIVFMENENWIRKIFQFIKRKLRGCTI